MSQPKPGSIVVLKAYGRRVNALVLAARYGETSHLGSDGEPILTLAFVDPARETGLTPVRDKSGKPTGEFNFPVNRNPQVFIETDIVHESHEFSDDFKKKHGLNSAARIADVRGHGEWTEYQGDASDTIGRLREKVAELGDKSNQIEFAHAQQKARGDKAEADAKDAKAQLAEAQKKIDAQADALKKAAADLELAKSSPSNSQQ